MNLIKRNAHLIQELHLKGDLPLGYYSLPCTHLLKLDIDYTGQTSSMAWAYLSLLLAKNSNMRQLVVSDQTYTRSSLFWATFSLCLNLKTVAIYGAKMESNDIDNFWNGCRGVKSLIVTGLRLDPLPSHPFFASDLGVFPNLESIYVKLEDKSRTVDQRWAKLRFPRLTKCYLNEDYEGNGPSRSSSRSSSTSSSSYDHDATMETTESTVPTLDQVFREQQLSNPDSLCVGSEIDFEDAELSSCLEVMDVVTMLTVDQGDFGPMSLQSLVPHFNALQSLLLGRCYSVTGSMVQRILESCPVLIEIAAPRIVASQIISRKRWSCLNLRTFTACIVLDSRRHSIGVQSRMIYLQLARLTQLEHLDISADRGRGIQSLDLQLASGMYQLSTLSKLWSLRYAGTVQHFSIDDVEWMREHWPLKTYPILQQRKARAKK